MKTNLQLMPLPCRMVLVCAAFDDDGKIETWAEPVLGMVGYFEHDYSGYGRRELRTHRERVERGDRYEGQYVRFDYVIMGDGYPHTLNDPDEECSNVRQKVVAAAWPPEEDEARLEPSFNFLRFAAKCAYENSKPLAAN